MKLGVVTRKWPEMTVAPRAGAWIETATTRRWRWSLSVAPRAGAWIETT